MCVFVAAMVDLPYQRDRLDERRKLWTDCDKSGNGYCSVAEIDSVFRPKYGFGEQQKMPLIEAFGKACNFSGKERGVSADFIEHGEFRIFLELLMKKLGMQVVPQTPAKENLMISAPKLKGQGSAQAAFTVDLPYKRESLAERKRLFHDCDPNGNGFCSVAEVDASLRRKYGFGSKQKMTLIHSFNEAKNFSGKEKGVSADYIEHGEFRVFLEILMKKLGMKVVPQSPAPEDLMIGHPKLKGGAASPSKPGAKGKADAPAKGAHFLQGSKVGSTRGFITIAGYVVAIPHPRPGRSQSCTELRHRFEGVSEHQHHFREAPYCYASMDKKPLEAYKPHAARNRLAVDDAPVPFKNASCVEFNDGIHTCHKRRFLTVNQVSITGEAPDPRTNQGSISEANILMRQLREK